MTDQRLAAFRLLCAPGAAASARDRAPRSRARARCRRPHGFGDRRSVTTRQRSSRLPPERRSPAISRSLPPANGARPPSSLPSSRSCCRRCSSPTPSAAAVDAIEPPLVDGRRRGGGAVSADSDRSRSPSPAEAGHSAQWRISRPASWCSATRSAARRSRSSSAQPDLPSRFRCACIRLA